MGTHNLTLQLEVDCHTGPHQLPSLMSYLDHDLEYSSEFAINIRDKFNHENVLFGGKK